MPSQVLLIFGINTTCEAMGKDSELQPLVGKDDKAYVLGKVYHKKVYFKQKSADNIKHAIS